MGLIPIAEASPSMNSEMQNTNLREQKASDYLSPNSVIHFVQSPMKRALFCDCL